MDFTSFSLKTYASLKFVFIFLKSSVDYALFPCMIIWFSTGSVVDWPQPQEIIELMAGSNLGPSAYGGRHDTKIPTSTQIVLSLRTKHNRAKMKNHSRMKLCTLAYLICYQKIVGPLFGHRYNGRNDINKDSFLV